MALPKEVIPPTQAQRCPRCRKLSLTFDTETNRVVCSACGYEVRLKT